MDSKERLMSNQVHKYLHELHYLWLRYLNKEFSLEEVMKKFIVSINMDKDLLCLYLEAHWTEHNEMEKKINKRFWNKVPEFIKMANKWNN